MAETIVDGGVYKFVFRHGTPEEWAASVSVLAEGEIGIAIDPADPTRTVARAGDGLRAWPDLPDIAGHLGGLLAEAKKHADDSVASTLTSAQQYADGLDAQSRTDWSASDSGIRKDFAAADQGRLIEAKQYADRGDESVLAAAQSHAEDFVRTTVVGDGTPTVFYLGNGVYEITGVPVNYLGNGVYEIGA